MLRPQLEPICANGIIGATTEDMSSCVDGLLWQVSTWLKYQCSHQATQEHINPAQSLLAFKREVQDELDFVDDSWSVNDVYLKYQEKLRIAREVRIKQSSLRTAPIPQQLMIVGNYFPTASRYLDYVLRDILGGIFARCMFA